MIRGVIYMSIGFAAGYCIHRAIEARAAGVPFSVAFVLTPEGMLTPIVRLAQTLPGLARPVGVQPILTAPRGLGPDDPMPLGIQDAEVTN
jgi:hypothetical protein